MSRSDLMAQPDPTAAHHAPARARRVALLVAAIVIMALGDLYATVIHATSVGMVELNPIGAYLIGAGWIGGLVCFKLGTLGVFAAALLKARRHAAAEWTAWALAVVMLALTLHWHGYNTELSAAPEVEYHHLAEALKPPLADASR